jgi:acyl-ACP thioesterase
MSPNISKHFEQFKIRASEVDLNGKATLPALCSLFQEVAGNHALMLNFDISQLHEQNLTWVLHRMDIKISRFPDWRETITIETWPAAGDALRAYRDYRILDENGTQIGCCLSYWMMMNLKTRRPTRMPKEVLELRLDEIEHVLPLKKDRPRPIKQTDVQKNFSVRRADLDMNKHVNNSKYLEWMLENLPEKTLTTINRVDIIFAKETYQDENIQAKVAFIEEATSKHHLINEKGETIALAEISPH